MTNQTPDNSRSSEDAPAIEGFRILEKLGHGATSSVWKAEQISLNRPVVIKVLSERLTHEPEDVALFKAEARMAANFKHAGIVQVYDFGQSVTSRCYYFVMEYISGYSVGDWVRRKGKISEAEALVVAHGVADALKYAWDLSKIVHCDIKPDNIMVDGDGSIKVADLGLAHTVKSIAGLSVGRAAEIIITGTPNYMAPEQVRGTEPIDCRTDIYALGASLYHMVTGQLPFGGSPPNIVLERQLREDFEYPQQVNPDLSVSVTRLIVKMTAKEPAARFQTWDEVLAEVIRLERQMRQQAAAATQPAAAPATASAGQPPAADSEKGGGLTGNGRSCRHCGKPMQPGDRYCGFCGKPVPTSKEAVEAEKEITIRLKPIKAQQPANSKPAAPPPGQAPWPQSAPGRWNKSWAAKMRMVISLILLVFLGYYTYQKVKNNRDVIVPIKAAVFRAIPPVLEKSRRYAEQGFQAGVQLSRRLIWSHLAKPAPPVDQPKVAPKETPAPPVAPEAAPVKPVVSAELPEAEQEPETGPESKLPPPAAAVAPEATETTAPAKPAEPAPSETPPTASAPPKQDVAPEPAAAPVKLPQEVEYERLLQICRQQQPGVGDRITLRFKNDREPVEGVFEQVTTEGVKIKVTAGVIEYPFRILSEECRSLYFPEERARRLQRQQIKKSE